MVVATSNPFVVSIGASESGEAGKDLDEILRVVDERKALGP